MKCPTCTTSQKRKEGMTCAKCGYVYAFDPKTDGVTDGKFLSLIRTASAKDTQYFTLNQLYAVYCRGRSTLIAAVFETTRSIVAGLGDLLCVIGIAGILGGWASDIAMLWIAGIPTVLVGLILRSLGRHTFEIAPARTEPPGPEPLLAWIRTWKAAGKPLAKLLEAPALHAPPAPYREGDIYDYGVERIVIVEHDLLVDLLVMNNQHAEQRALVIAESGYPSYLVPHARRLLEQRPDLPVVLFHDATAHGTAMASRLRQAGWLPLAGRRLIDAGLYPADVPRIRSLSATLPGTYGNAARADYLPLAAMAGGLAGVVGVGVLASSAMAHGSSALVVSNGVDASGDHGGGGWSGDGSTGAVEGSGGGEADFAGGTDGGDGDFG